MKRNSRSSPSGSDIGAPTASLIAKSDPAINSDITFDPNSEELKTSWHSGARVVLCINPYPNGITVSLHTGFDEDFDEDKAEQQPGDRLKPSQFHLRVKELRDYRLPEGKFFLFKEGWHVHLEKRLSALHRRGLLASTVVYFGCTNDPFFALHKKFDVTIKCLELLEQYKPALVVVQTRSPMVISALPMLKSLSGRVVASIAVETFQDQAVTRYTPGQPRIGERCLAADGLRSQGIPVALQVSPILPYGELYRDAWDFAELLDRHADFITLGCLADGDARNEAQLKETAIAKRLVADNQLAFLRPHAYRYLYHALSNVTPKKLRLPVKAESQAAQLDLFAA